MRRLGRQLGRYLATGGLAAGVDIGGFAVLKGALTGLAPGVLLPAILSFLLAAGVNYLASARWVFAQDWRSRQRAGRFLAGACLGLAVNAGSTAALAAWALWPPLAAKVAGVGLAFGVNFSVNRLWVFGSGAGGGAADSARSTAATPGPSGACADAPEASGRTTHWAARAAAWRPRPSARE